MPDDPKPRLVGVNHVALEVGDIDEALAFYGRIFSFELRGRSDDAAFIDMGDQFIALMKNPRASATENKPRAEEDGGERERHFGLVVDDRSRVRELAAAAGAQVLDGRFLDFLDPWGNRVQVVEYRDLQFQKTGAMLRAMGLDLPKSAAAREELRAKGVEV